jgi:lipopolysaccharide/colanic/teichoic acid biosynthesis glycosyltransferase
VNVAEGTQIRGLIQLDLATHGHTTTEIIDLQDFYRGLAPGASIMSRLGAHSFCDVDLLEHDIRVVTRLARQYVEGYAKPELKAEHAGLIVLSERLGELASRCLARSEYRHRSSEEFKDLRRRIRVSLLTLVALCHARYLAHAGGEPIRRYDRKRDKELRPARSPRVITSVLSYAFAEMYADMWALEQDINNAGGQRPALTYVRSNAPLGASELRSALWSTRRPRQPWTYVKTVFDRTAALAGLVVFSPILVPLALLIKFTSPGPAMFRQTRAGRNAKPFTMFKFRTMYSGAERRTTLIDDRADGLLFKIRDDPRVTRVGKFLRRYSLDELPQLINVLRGDMSLVGPRPPLPGEVEQYDLGAARRLLVKPGLTGIWQMSGRSDLSWEESIEMDLDYVEQYSFRLDMRILVGTFFAVVRGSGAY